MALFPDDPQDQLKLLIAILALAAGALYFNFLYRPASDELLDLTDRVENLETQNQLAETRIGNLQQLRDQLGTAERQLSVLEHLVPEGSEVPEIYEAIAQETQALNLRLLSIEPLAPVVADSAGTLLRQEWSLVVEGGYHALGRFLTNVASFERIVRPRVTEIVPAGTTGGGNQLVQATFSLETFVLSPGGQAAEAAPPAAGSSGDATEEGLVGG
ncbi:MAG: type 4a pilus biogenesis protein PilO [Gemmatimonadales bacterium]